MTTPQDAIADVARMAEAARRERDSLPVEEAARRAWHHGGPSVEEIAQQIRALRKSARKSA